MSTLLKMLRKILRRQKGLVTLGTLLIVLFVSLYVGNLKIERSDEILSGLQGQGEAIDVINPAQLSVHLITEYMCGVQTEIKTFDSVQEMEEWLIQYHDDWDKVERKDGVFRMIKYVSDDLSPICKAEGYFGLTDDHILTIYEGPPVQNKIIQTFFRIDTERLESKMLQDELLTLKRGIRIHNVEEYLSVLSTFGEFATEY